MFLIVEGLVSKLLSNYQVSKLLSTTLNSKSKFMYGSAIRSALLPAWVCPLPLAVGLVSKLGATVWHPCLAGLDQMSPNKRPFGPPTALKGFIAKRSFGAWLPSSPAASVLPWPPDLLLLTSLQAHKFKSILCHFLDSFLSLQFLSLICHNSLSTLFSLSSFRRSALYSQEGLNHYL